MKTIYAVKTLDGQISYVGCTKNLKSREIQHRAYNKDVDCLIELEQVEDAMAKERELFWIKKKLEEGCPLRNRENKDRVESWIRCKDGEVAMTLQVPESTYNLIKLSAQRNYRSLQKEATKALNEVYDINKADRT